MKFNNRNVFIGKNVKLGENVRIGDNTAIYDNVIIEDNSIIGSNCIIGEPLHKYYIDSNYDNPVLKIRSNSIIRSFTTIYAGSEFGPNLTVGHYTTIREQTIIGRNCSIGSYNDIQGTSEIGDYSRLQSYVGIGQHTKIGKCNFIFPGALFTNDPKPPSNNYKGPEIGNYNVIASSAVILPEIKIGDNCLIGANSTVNSNVQDYSFVSGNPSKYIMDIRKLPLFTNGKRHYPWQRHFERGMPWEGVGFEEWLKLNS